MAVPAHTLRVVFALSALACSVILVLFVRGRAAWTTGFWVQLVAAAVAVAAVLCWLVFRHGRLRLVGVPSGPFFRVFLLQLMLGYVASALAITAIALAVIYWVTRSGADSLALAVLAGLWLALWLAPGVAALTSWLKLRSMQSNDA
ncbi:MAG: hypothetical protein LCI02_02285 [Proteobacteria bacterium]|nr:hypothetical protein [Pseudomonadota bacterium]